MVEVQRVGADAEATQKLPAGHTTWAVVPPLQKYPLEHAACEDGDAHTLPAAHRAAEVVPAGQ